MWRCPLPYSEASENGGNGSRSQETAGMLGTANDDGVVEDVRHRLVLSNKVACRHRDLGERPSPFAGSSSHPTDPNIW